MHGHAYTWRHNKEIRCLPKYVESQWMWQWQVEMCAGELYGTSNIIRDITIGVVLPGIVNSKQPLLNLEQRKVQFSLTVPMEVNIYEQFSIKTEDRLRYSLGAKALNAIFGFFLYLASGHCNLPERSCTLDWTPNFCGCGCHQRTPLYILVLVTHGAYACGSHGTVTNGERVLHWLPPPCRAEQQRGNTLRSPVVLWKRPISLSS